MEEVIYFLTALGILDAVRNIIVGLFVIGFVAYVFKRA